MFKVDSAGIRKQLKWSRWYTHTHTHTHTSVPALLTWQNSWYFIKIEYSEPNISAPASVSLLEHDWSTKTIIYIINNSFALRYVTSQIWKYYGIFGFVPNERGRIHEHKAAFRKQLSAQVFKVYVSVYVRDAFRISTWFSSHPMWDWIAPSAGRPSVSLIYNYWLHYKTSFY